MGRAGIRGSGTSGQSAGVLSRCVRAAPGRRAEEQSIVDDLCRDAGKLDSDIRPRGEELVKRVRAVAHVDDRRRWTVYRSILDGNVDMGSPIERRLAEMLFYSLNPNGGGFASPAAGLDAIQGEAVVDELREVIDIAFDSSPPQHL